jgi:hypothetical protein
LLDAQPFENAVEGFLSVGLDDELLMLHQFRQLSKDGEVVEAL